MLTRRPAPPSAKELHRRWLALIDTDGPFLAVPPLTRVWPQGMPQLDADAARVLSEAKPEFDRAWDDWDRHRDDPGALERYQAARDVWVETVLRDVLGWAELWSRGDAVAASAQVSSPDRSVTVSPTGALRHGDRVGALVWVVDPVSSLRDMGDDAWAASPIDRMEQMLRASGVPIGVVADGRWWALVSAPEGSLAASGITDAQTWIEERSVRNAFATLLSHRALLAGRESDRLPVLFTESVLAAEEVTEALGVQIRKAVELVVHAFSEAGADARSHGDADPLPDQAGVVYDAVVTVLMRIVFLLFAQERGLLPQGQLFESAYGLAGRLDELEARARAEGDEALDATHHEWHRLMATSQALYQGATFEDMRLPAYGGSLFDPDRFPFLTARTERGTLALAVSDRVMGKVLDAVQRARPRGQEARRISFRDIDVEQIGYIYEGLLGYSCQRSDEVLVGAIGKDGAEPEVPLRLLEAWAQEHETDGEIADAMIAWVKEHQPASALPTRSALTKALASGDRVEDAERALRAVTTDAKLRERLRPWVGVIRRDLRDRPVVIEPGGLLVTETSSRRNAGAHYTPRALAEEVVLHALEPLVYHPGPRETSDREAWKLKSSSDIGDLKIADIACGSGAFLVGAARYLAAKLVEAWHREGSASGSPAQLETKALREVVAHCLYGADINAMAVEMCKLSLWLVSLDRDLPFSFVDDKVLHGNSLLGLTSVRQLRELSIDRPTGDQVQLIMLFSGANELVRGLDIDAHLRRAIRLRELLASEIDERDPQRNAHAKHNQLREFRQVTVDLRRVADGVVAAGLRVGGKPGRALDEAYENLRDAVAQAYPGERGTPDDGFLSQIIDAGLTPTVETDYERWEPLHWALAVPDVMERGGFDAIIGNPPFLGGQKLTGAMGTNVRDWFVNVLADGERGSADLVAYFFLRAQSLLTPTGTLGLIATNTVAQGDTRQVGLDRMVTSGFTITRAVQSRSWPAASANLEYAAIWGTVGRVAEAAPRVSDDAEVARISTLLEPAGRVDGHPHRLAENADIAFIGCYVLGMGFVLEPEEAQQWIDDDPRNAEVLFPYLNGEDLNSRPDSSPSRWVIDFNDRSKEDAATYPRPFEQVEAEVRPERDKNNRKVYRDRWWQFGERRPALRKAIKTLDEVMTVTITSRTLMPARVTSKQVLSHMLVAFANSSYDFQAVVSSGIHQMWVAKYGSGMRGDARYIPSDCFETFPRPKSTDALAQIGKTLDTERREIMLRRQLGLTKLYNLVNDPDILDDADPDVARMRQIHVDLDHAVMAAYGWDDVPLDHGFHTYRQMQRWTVSPAARVEILERLLEENHRRPARVSGSPRTTDDEE